MLANGPFETTIGIHGVNVMVTKKAQIIAADATGMIARIKGGFGGYSGARLYPWPAIMFIEIED